MDRLTKRISGYTHGAEGVSADRLTGNYCRGEFEATACVEKLAEYEDLEEQGKLLKLPCAVGDTVCDNDFGRPCSYEVTGFSFGKIDDDEENDIDGLQMYYRNWNGSIRCSCAVSEIGKTFSSHTKQPKPH